MYRLLVRRVSAHAAGARLRNVRPARFMPRGSICAAGDDPPRAYYAKKSGHLPAVD